MAERVDGTANVKGPLGGDQQHPQMSREFPPCPLVSRLGLHIFTPSPFLHAVHLPSHHNIRCRPLSQMVALAIVQAVPLRLPELVRPATLMG